MCVIRLDTENLTLAFTIEDGVGPQYLYFGKKIDNNYSFEKYYLKEKVKCMISLSRPLLSTYGGLDFREYSHIIKNGDGSYSNTFEFVKILYDVTKDIKGLPQGRNPDKTICFVYLDKGNNIEIKIYYSVYKKANVFSSYCEIINHSNDVIHLLKASSLQLQINENKMTAITFDGCWANERQRTETKLTNGLFINSSVNGMSSHLHNPLTLLTNKKDYYGFNIIYSGNHKTSFEAGFFNRTNVIVGINDFLFDYTLDSNKTFITPEVIFTYGKNENEISQNFHYFIINNLLQPQWSRQTRPIIFNNWEGTYFNFDGNKILSIAKQAKELGAECFVLDDGWFSNRNNDDSSLGDWRSNKEKTLGGLSNLSKEIKKLGLKFGIWMEPEMISPNSDLYRNHKDYAMETKNHPSTLSRNQLVLDLTMPEVKEFVYNTICNIIDEANADYVKHDFNRQMTDIFGKDFPTGEYFHRYMLSFYEIMGRVTKKYPNVLFEGCAGGGGRFDLGMLYYFSQIWTSDNTDPRMRILIQDSTLIGYPQIAMACHVSASPNHQTGHTSKLEDRFNVAISGNLGYELDPLKLSEQEKEIIKTQINFYKSNRELIQNGKLFRLSYKDIVKGTLITKDNLSILLIYKLRDKDFTLQLPDIFEDKSTYTINSINLSGFDLNNKPLPSIIFNHFSIDKKYTASIKTEIFIIKKNN